MAVSGLPDPTITLGGFFTAQGWLRGACLADLERLLGYHGQLLAAGAAVYAFQRVPEIFEFELKGYTNVPGGMAPDPAWVAAERAAAPYYKRTGLDDAETVRKKAARATMTVRGENRLVKIKPLIAVTSDYPPGRGIPQWRITDRAAQLGALTGVLVTTISLDGRYPLG